MASLSVKPTPPLKATEMHLDDTMASARQYEVISRPFAGRVVGNQHFTIEADTVKKDDLLKRIPDAAPYLTWGECFDLKPFGELELWKHARVEGCGE